MLPWQHLKETKTWTQWHLGSDTVIKHNGLYKASEMWLNKNTWQLCVWMQWVCVCTVHAYLRVCVVCFSSVNSPSIKSEAEPRQYSITSWMKESRRGYCEREAWPPQGILGINSMQLLPFPLFTNALLHLYPSLFYYYYFIEMRHSGKTKDKRDSNTKIV